MFLRLVVLIAVLTLPTASFAGFFDFIFTPRFKEGIVKDNQLQQEIVKKTAEESNDIFSFIDSLYQIKVIKKSSHYAYIDEKVPSKTNQPSNLWEYKIFPLYCSSKGGKAFLWDSSHGRPSGADFVFGCEVDGQVTSAILDFIIKDNLPVNPYSHSVAYVDGEGFKQYLDKYNLYSYVDSTAMVGVKPLDKPVKLKKNSVQQQIQQNFRYEVALNIINNTNNPQQYDLTAMRLFAGERSFDIEKQYNSNKSPISWKYYQNLNINFTNSRFKLNPGQNFTGVLRASISGLPTEELAGVNLSIAIGEHQFTGLVLKSDYDFFKKLLDQSN